jgi:hypothetical protein
MRLNIIYTVIICTVISLSCACLAQTNLQATSESTPSFDLAGSPLPGPGVYAMPFTPVLATPIAEFPQPVLQVGASNSTGENIVGAQNATMSALPQQVNPLLIAPRLAGAPISYDLYPRAR